MKDIQDNQIEEKQALPKPVLTLIFNAFMYLAAMFIGGFILYSIFIIADQDPIAAAIYNSNQLIMITLIVTLIDEAVSWIRKKLKNKEIKWKSPLWFAVVENMMFWWIIVAALTYVINYFF